MAKLETWLEGAIETKSILNAKDIIEIGYSLEEYLQYKKTILTKSKGYKRDNIKDDIEAIENILRKFKINERG